MSDVQRFLDASSGSKYPPYKWGSVGQILTGTIIETPRVIERPDLNTGEPKPNLVINLETPEGEFTVWVRAGFLAQAIADAVKASGAAGLEQGGKLSVKHTEDRDTGRPQKARVFAARYEPPSPSAVAVDDIFAS